MHNKIIYILLVAFTAIPAAPAFAQSFVPPPSDCFDSGTCYASSDATGPIEQSSLYFYQFGGGMGFLMIWGIVVFALWYMTDFPMLAGMVGVIIALVLQSGGYFADPVVGEAIRYSYLMLGVGFGVTVYGLVRWKLHQQ